MVSAYLRLLIFLLAILIPTCASSSLVFLMMYYAYKLNKQGDNIQPWHTPFPIWNQSVVPCPVLTVASWSAYKFLRRQVKWSGIPISFRIFQFVVIHTVKGFGIVSKAEIDVFLELSYFSSDPADVGNFISGSSAFSKISLNIWKFTVHVLLKPGLENFEHYFWAFQMMIQSFSKPLTMEGQGRINVWALLHSAGKGRRHVKIKELYWSSEELWG